LRDVSFLQNCYWDSTPCRLVNVTFLLYIQCTGRLGRLLLSVGKSSAIVISGFRREVDENCVLLGYYAASGCDAVPTIRDDQLVPSSGVKKKKLAPSSILRKAKIAYYARNMFEAGRFFFRKGKRDVTP